MKKSTIRKLKGVSMIAELISFFFMIATGYFLGGALIMVKGASMIAPDVEYDLTVHSGMYLPVMHENAMTSFMECTVSVEKEGKTVPIHDAISMKRIISALVEQNTKQDADVIIEGFNIDVEDATENILKASGWGTDVGEYIMYVRYPDGGEYKLIGDVDDFIEGKDVIQIQRLEEKIFSSRGIGTVEMYISG